MSSLKKKLSRLAAAGPESSSAEVAAVSPETQDGDGAGERVDSFRRRMRGIGRGRGSRGEAARAARRQVVAQSLPGAAEDFPGGRVQVVRQDFGTSHLHGSVAVHGARRVLAATLVKLSLDSSLEGVDPERALFLDTETTGLAGGAGTVPFLIGMGWFEGDAFVVEQLLLPRPGEEAPMLRRLADLIAWADCVVTYNGKSYDWPLLRTRFVMNRIEVPELPPHLDLLHGARRVFGTVLPNMRLISIEEEVLSFERVGDIPGSMIPDTWFGFLRDGDGSKLVPVVEHNVHDILALAAMLGVLSGLVSGPSSKSDPRVQLAVARLQHRSRDDDAAMTFIEYLRHSDAKAPVLVEAVEMGASILRRRRIFDGAVELLRVGLEVTDLSCEQSASLHLMLAKLYEHRLKDPEQALEHASQTEAVEGGGGCEKRVRRLKARLERAARI